MDDIEELEASRLETRGNCDVDIVLPEEEMTLQERNEAYEDVHGVGKAVEETPELLSISLEEMKDCLSATDHPDKKSYLIALQKNNDYVLSDRMLLPFLRCDRFEITLATKRYFKYYALIERVFGQEALGRDLLLTDLTPEQQQHFVDEAHVQFLRQRDSMGRAIQFIDPMILMRMYNGPVEEEIFIQRCCFYLVMRQILDSEDTQRYGVVSIFYGVDNRLKVDEDFAKIPDGNRFLQSVGGGFEAVPMRINAVHFLWNDERIRPFMSLYRHALGRAISARFLAHYGNIEECHTKLINYGIPVWAIPLTSSGIISYNMTAKTIRQYQVKEEDVHINGGQLGVDWSKGVMVPTKHDVLLGRGRPYQDHYGNVQLRGIICEYWNEYDSSTKRGGKAEIAERVVRKIHALGGRFLKLHEKADDWWFPVPEKEAIAKVSQGFRKKREMDAAAGPCPLAKKNASSGKRSKVQQESIEPVDRATTSDDWLDTLTAEEFDFILKGLAKPSTPGHESDTSATVFVSDQSASAQNDHVAAFEDCLARIHDPREQQQHAVPVDLPTEVSDSMLSFLQTHHNCFKCSPIEAFSWLKGQDVMTIEDLQEACRDEDFVELDLVAKGGLKAFKRRPFVKAIDNVCK